MGPSKTHAGWVSRANEEMRMMLKQMEGSGIMCEIPKASGAEFTWREWFEFLGYRESGY